MSESIAVGANVGAPVTAYDPDPEDVVTYELVDNDTVADNDLAEWQLILSSFNVDRASGQLTVAQKLDADLQRDTDGDGDMDDDDRAVGEYEVVVRATDPSGVA